MADLSIDSVVIDEVAGELRQAKIIIDLQCSTLNEVSQIIEHGWQCKETARLRQCIEHTRNRLQNNGKCFAGIAGNLEQALREAKQADTLKAFGWGDGGGGIR